MSDEHSRYEINRKVRQILVSHNADLTKISYSFIGKTVYLFGSLMKDPQGDFNLTGVKALVADLMKLPRVHDIQFDLENWVISVQAGDMSITKGRGSTPMPGVKNKNDF
ncbi:MAG TPA: hypothetical protein P5040_07100 [Smithella sp.]|nr:hypothetical protein [Smithella sp.]HRS97937.1 hypothetical protein [Smithella sp.]